VAQKKEISPAVAAIVIVVIVVIIVAVYFLFLSPKKAADTGGQINAEAKAKMEAAKRGEMPSGFLPPELQKGGGGGKSPMGGGMPPELQKGGGGGKSPMGGGMPPDLQKGGGGGM